MTATPETETKNGIQRTSRIPEFASIEEEAEFWDTHDTTEFEDEFEDVDEEMRFIVMTPNQRWIPLVLDDDVMTALEERATRERVAPAMMIRDWVLERLKAS